MSDSLYDLKFWSVETNHPVALTSVDHLYPEGTARDNTHAPGTAQMLLSILPEEERSVLDIGCAGGGWVKDCLDLGFEAVGIEGSDYSKNAKRAEWATIPGNLFTADARYPFRIYRKALVGTDRSRYRFNVVTAWEFLEHIEEDGLDGVLSNITRHLEIGGWFVGSISLCPWSSNGVEYHVTVRDRNWWDALFGRHGFVVDPGMTARWQGYWVRPGDYCVAYRYMPHAD